MRQANCDGRGRKIDPRPTKSADRRTSAVSAPRRGDGRGPESILSGAPFFSGDYVVSGQLQKRVVTTTWPCCDQFLQKLFVTRLETQFGFSGNEQGRDELC